MRLTWFVPLMLSVPAVPIPSPKTRYCPFDTFIEQRGQTPRLPDELPYFPVKVLPNNTNMDYKKFDRLLQLIIYESVLEVIWRSIIKKISFLPYNAANPNLRGQTPRILSQESKS